MFPMLELTVITFKDELVKLIGSAYMVATICIYSSWEAARHLKVTVKLEAYGGEVKFQLVRLKVIGPVFELTPLLPFVRILVFEFELFCTV
jgi:hypothetical protein